MTSKDIPADYRISKTTKKLMIAVGVFFDLVPIIAILAMMFVVFQLSGGFFINNAANNASLASKYCAEAKKPSTGGIAGWYHHWLAKNACETYTNFAKEHAVIGVGIATISGGLVAFFVGPIIYTAVSFISTFVAYTLFFFWFGFKGVNMWSFRNEKRILTNIGTFIIENIPVVDLLPGTTFMVWMHIKLSRNEDVVKTKEKNEKIKRKLRNMQAKPTYA